MFIDASDACSMLNFNIAAGETTITRQWDIKITQYECGSEIAGGSTILIYIHRSWKNINYRTPGLSPVLLRTDRADFELQLQN